MINPKFQIKYKWPNPRSCLGAFFIFLIVSSHAMFFVPRASSGEGEIPGREHFIKAGFIYNFTKFIKWPKNSINPSRDRFIIAVLGDSPILECLRILAREEKNAGGKKLTIEHFTSLDEIGECQILFISPSMTGRLEEIFKTVEDRPILVIGEAPGFAERGGGVNFFVLENKIRFEFNMNAMDKANLKIDPLLIEVGRIVK